MAIVTGDRYVELLVNFVEKQAESLLEGTLILKLNPVGLHYVQSRLEALQELERLRTGAPVDYLRAYIADLGDHRALEQLRRVLRLLTSIKVVSVLPHPCRDPTPLSLLPFGRLRSLELRGCDLSTSAARGLLELRNTLEKIICHNSTEALRHIFAGRIVEIQDCPAWTRLSFVSCASNNMVLMDESLQLLPAVETLDLSRNRFAKIASLHKCMHLKYLDLGFNSIRTISSLNEVTARITKLILRNNALTTLHGIENIATLEGLDLSFNMISNFAEIELLSSLPVLESVWLEGNPISCARLYREQVFSFFSNPHKLKLDDKVIRGREVWTVKVIAARRQMQRPGYGFYSPAKGEIHSDVNSELGKFSEQHEANSSGDFQSKAKKRIARLASIEDPDHKRYLLSEGVEQDGSGSPVHESESQRKDEKDIGENDRADALSLFDRIELLKKEDSSAWFQKVSDLLYPTNVDKEDYVQGTTFNSKRQSHMRRRRQNRVDNSSSKVKLEDKEGSMGHHDKDTPEAELQHMSDDEGNAGKIVDEVQENGLLGNFSLKGKTVSNSFVKHATSLKPWLNSGIREVNSSEEQSKVLISNTAGKLPGEGMAYLCVPGTVANEEMCSGESFGSLKTIEEIIESHSSSFCLSSPPHYQEDILHRRQNLEEEFMQLSLDSYSIASSSDSESSSDDQYLSDSSSSIDGQTVSHADADTDNDNANGESNIVPEDFNEVSGKCQHSLLFKDTSRNAHSCLDSNAIEDSKMEHTVLSRADDILADEGGGRIPQTVTKDMSHARKTTGTWKHKRRVVLLDEVGVFDAESEQIQDPSSSLCVNNLKNGMTRLASTQAGLAKSDGSKEIIVSSFNKVYPYTNCAESSNCNIKTVEMPVSVELDDPLKHYFHRQLADDRLSESCLYHFSCNCIRLWEDDPDERSQKAAAQFFWIGGQQLKSSLGKLSECRSEMYGGFSEKDVVCWESNVLWSLKHFEDVSNPLVLWDVLMALLALKVLTLNLFETILSKWLSSWFSGSRQACALERCLIHLPRLLSKASCRRIHLIVIICRRLLLSGIKTESLSSGLCEVDKKEIIDKREQLKGWTKLLQSSEHELRERLVYFTLSAISCRASYVQPVCHLGKTAWVPAGAPQIEKWVSLNSAKVPDPLKQLAGQIRELGRKRVACISEYAASERCTFCNAPVQFKSPELAYCQAGRCNSSSQNHKLQRCAVSMQVCPAISLWFCICCERWALKQAPDMFFYLSSLQDVKYLSEHFLLRGCPKPLCPFCGILMQRLLPEFLLTSSPV